MFLILRFQIVLLDCLRDNEREALALIVYDVNVHNNVCVPWKGWDHKIPSRSSHMDKRRRICMRCRKPRPWVQNRIDNTKKLSYPHCYFNRVNEVGMIEGDKDLNARYEKGRIS